MMKLNKTFTHIIQVGLSNVVTMLVGILTGFVVPKVLTIDGYGLYKTFTLYITYIGFCSLGIVDGIVLTYGDFDYEKLDKILFRSYFKFFLLINVAFSISLFFILSFIGDTNLRFVFSLVSINIIFLNITGYYQQISQITLRFKEYSIVRMLQSFLNILLVISLMIKIKNIDLPTYKIYILGICIINFISMIWYLFRYKDITFGKSKSLKQIKNTIFDFINIGFPLLFANICSTLILTLDRQFVNIFFNNTIYAKYSFAYSMVSLITVATSAIATVIYPTLKRKDENQVKTSFPILVSIILILLSFLISSYFPLKLFIEWYLPKYADSLLLFRIIFPGLIISSAITVVMHNYYKILGKNIIFFRRSVFVLFISILLNLFVVLILKNSIFISIVFVVTMIIWYLYIEKYFIDTYDYKSSKNFIYLIISIIIFYLTTSLENNFVGMLTYVVLEAIFIKIYFKSDIKKMFFVLKNNN